MDVEGGAVVVSTSELSYFGQSIQLEEIMDISIVTTKVVESDYLMFFDTGVQISYLQDGSLSNLPSAGSVSNFYLGIARFQIDTHEIPVSLSGFKTGLHRRTLARLLKHAILSNQTVGCFPRRGLLSI